jgi:hypothetical protein
VPDPASLESAGQLEAFLATVVLGAHLRDLPPGERRPFVRAVATRLDEPVVDYVRLQIRATRTAGQGVSSGSSACCASTGRAPRRVAVVAHSSAMGSSSALRCIPPAAARDGQDPRNTP